MAGSVLWEKKGPLPVWAWALLVLGLVLVATIWRRNRAAPEPVTDASTTTDTGLSNLSAGPIFIVPGATTPGPAPVAPRPGPWAAHRGPVTVPGAPPGAGRPGPPMNPVAPSNLRMGAATKDTMTLAWDPVSNASGYALKNVQEGIITSVAPGTTSVTLRNLIRDGTYFWQIAAKNAAGGNGPWSPTITTHTRVG